MAVKHFRFAVALVLGITMGTGLATAQDISFTNFVDFLASGYSSGGHGGDCGCEAHGVADCDACVACDVHDACNCCDDRFGLELFAGLDAWRQGRNEGFWQDNFGARVAANVGIPLIDSRDIGLQMGASYGLYDWNGRAAGRHPEHDMQQTFVTVGLFQNCSTCDNCDIDRRISWGIVYDWMFADFWGQFGDTSLTLSQWRGEISYALNACNSLGVYGALSDRGDQSRGYFFNFGSTTYRSIDQVDFFWQHSFESGATGRLWVGIPENNALSRPGSTIDLIVGAQFTAPLNSRVSAYGAVQYANPSASTAARGFGDAAQDYYYNATVGLVWYPRGRSDNVCKCRWNPLLPVADNMTFLVDEGSRGYRGPGIPE